MVQWTEYRFGDKVKLLSGGTPSKSNSEYWDGHIPWVSTKDLVTDRIYITKDYVTEIGAENGTRRIPAETILLSVRGMRLANELPISMAMRDVTFNQDLKAVIPDDDVDNHFLFYWFKGYAYEIRGLADEAAHGTKRIQTDRLQDYKLCLPPLETQRRIAAILSAYDDLIENNTHRIKALEQAAHDLYREWFVHFRFPGHESVELVDSDTDYGMIPHGWEIKPLQEVCELTMGQSPKSEFYNEHGEGLPFHQGVSTFGIRFPVTERWTTVKNRVADPGDILFSVRAPVGRMNIADTQLVLGRGLSAIRHKRNYQAFLYQQLTAIFYEEDLIGGGTIYQSVTKKDMQSVALIVPDEPTTEIFEGHAAPIDREIAVLDEKNFTLREARDLLLPRLVSGQLAVDDVEPILGE